MENIPCWQCIALYRLYSLVNFTAPGLYATIIIGQRPVFVHLRLRLFDLSNSLQRMAFQASLFSLESGEIGDFTVILYQGNT